MRKIEYNLNSLFIKKKKKSNLFLEEKQFLKKSFVGFNDKHWANKFLFIILFFKWVYKYLKNVHI